MPFHNKKRVVYSSDEPEGIKAQGHGAGGSWTTHEPHHQVVVRAVDLREYQEGWDRLKSVRQYSGSQSDKSPYGKTLLIKDVYNYVGKKLYGQNAVSQISVDQMANDLSQKPFRQTRDNVQLGIELLEDFGLVDFN